MKSQPDISVIIPIYNTEAYLARQLDSVLAQEDVDLEVILVDDGSSDASPDICQRYSQQHTNVAVLRIPNSGPATAKNKGLTMARGEYVAMIDSDDRLTLRMFAEMLEAAHAHGADIVCCNYIQEDEDGHATPVSTTGQTIIHNHDSALVALLSKDKIHSQSWTKLFRRELLTQHHILHPEGLRTDEDFILNVQAFVHSQCVVVVDKPLYIYTHRDASLAHSYHQAHLSRYIDNRLLRAETVDRLTQGEKPAIRRWSRIHNMRYYNELLGRVAPTSTLHTDPRIARIHHYMRRHASLLLTHHTFCGLSTPGALLLLLLPTTRYMSYRFSSIRRR